MPFASKNRKSCVTTDHYFQKENQPNDSLVKRELFAVSLRKEKRTKILEKKREKLGAWK